MEIPVRLGRVQSLQEHFQISTPHGIVTKSLFDGVRGCCFSVHLQAPAKASVLHLVFRNFYTAALRLVQLHTDGSSTVLLDEYPPMQHVHYEDDAQNWHLLQLDKLQAPVDVSKLESLVIYIFQPSPLWEKWELQHLKLYAAAAPVKPADSDELRSSTGTTNSISTTRHASGTSASSSSLNSTNQSEHHQGRERLLKRPSRMALAACVESKDVQGHSLQCLTLIDRLRGLLYSNQP